MSVRIIAAGHPDVLIAAREAVSPVQTWPLQIDGQLPGRRACGVEAYVENLEQAEELLTTWAMMGVWGAVVQDSDDKPDVRAVLALAVATRHADGGPQRG